MHVSNLGHRIGNKRNQEKSGSPFPDLRDFIQRPRKMQLTSLHTHQMEASGIELQFTKTCVFLIKICWLEKAPAAPGFSAAKG